MPTITLTASKGEFELGGVYEYVYEGDKLVKRNTYVDEALTEKFEEVIYTYDDKGRLDEENVYSSFFGDEMTFSSGTKYIYDDKDRMVEKISTIGDFFHRREDACRRRRCARMTKPETLWNG